MSFLALRALRSAGSVALLTAALVALASGVRLLPLVLDEAVAWSTALAFAQILTVPGSQTVLLVAVPTGCALLGSDLVASGEARALAALGVGPRQLALAISPAIVVLALGPLALTATFGETARSPGRFVGTMLGRASAACGPARPISRVPWVGAVALCEGSSKVLALSAPGALLRAHDVTFALDLRSASLADARVDLRGPPRVVLRTPVLNVRGAAPFALPLAVDHAVRTGAIVLAAALGGLASFLALLRRRESRLWLSLLVSGAVPALAALALLDARAPQNGAWWLSLPLAAALPAAIFWARGETLVPPWGPSRGD